MIKIMKASAGSGKTFNLAKTYITVLLGSEDRYAYRSILAVTFTNKATAEMKNRILKELKTLSKNPQESDYYDDLVPAVLPSADRLRQKSLQVLTDILHDYGSFAVSTIDRFFQQALRAFAREIGQMANYQIELDKESLVNESVDRMLDALTEGDTELIGWLSESVSDSISEGRRPDIVNKLYDMAARLFQTERAEVFERSGTDPATFLSGNNLRKVRKACREIIVAYEKDVREAARAILDVLDAAGVDPKDSNSGFLKQVRKFLSFPDGAAMPTPAFFNNAADRDLWFSKTKAKSFLPLVEGVLDGPLETFCSLFGERARVYNSAVIISDQVYSLGLSSQILKEFDAMLKEKNVLSLDDSNAILKKIIDGSDAPFIYEKLGVRFRHFLLDEFQDTSTVQWENFLPLLRESDSTGGTNLVVGDVKQSIYRWRGSDWELLDREVQRTFPSAETKPLDENWRSASKIVSFNNRFFAYAANYLQRQFDGAPYSIADIYADVTQTAKSSEPQEGCVRVTYCDKEETLSKVEASLREAKAAGASWGDMAVLVRKNDLGERVAATLVAGGIPVISDELLNVKSSVIVSRLIALLGSYDNPDDKISRYLSSSLEVSFPKRFHSLCDLCEDILRQLREADRGRFEGETLYIQSFMDTLLDWTSRYGNKLSGFLAWWDDAKVRLSSPAQADAVRIMTIHKAKGLEFPYVVFPVADDSGWTPQVYNATDKWCSPDRMPSPVLQQGVYPVKLIGDAVRSSAFGPEYDAEIRLRMVDAINSFYVAFTRAEKSLHVIAPTPSQQFLNSVGSGSPVCSDLSQILYSYIRCDEYVYGTPYDFKRMKREKASGLGSVAAAYPSFPVNPPLWELDENGEEVPVGEKSRLKFAADASDFFAEDGVAGVGASNRLKGIVLHRILSEADTAADIPAAVARSVARAEIDAKEGEEFAALLQSRLERPEVAEWFEPGAVLLEKERALIDSDGSVYRPDRVVSTGGGVAVIDYKFGAPERRYARQVSRYADIYRRLGYRDVKAYLWYVPENEIVPV